jgi:hypothetical protein
MQDKKLIETLKRMTVVWLKVKDPLVTMSGFDYFSIADVKVMEIYSLCMALKKLSERPSKRKM